MKRLIKRVMKFLIEYKLFSLAALALIVALVFQLSGLHTVANWILAIVAIIELLPLLWNMWQDIRLGKYGVDILAATAIIASVLLKEYWAGMVVVLMLTGGEALEDFAEHRAKSELDQLLKNAPRKAHIIRKGKTIDITVDEIKVGDRLLIKAGELVPVDSVILEGTASFDESSLTGESLPQARQVNDQLLSGSINLDGAVTAKALVTAEGSQYQQIVKLVKSASANQAPFVRLADRYSVPFTLAAYALAGSVWLISGEPIRFLEVIIVATPCPLLLAAPIALISGMARASKYGIIVRTGKALERLADARTIAFDKTGTLTSGELTVEKVVAVGKLDSKDVLSLAAGLEQNSNHVVAHAIVNEAKKEKIKLAKAKHIKEISGRGVQAELRGQQILVGRLSLLEEHNVVSPKKKSLSSINQTAVFVAVDGEMAGYITFKDEVRPETAETLDLLTQLGIEDLLMITGDSQSTADAIAKNLGMSNVHAEMLPADKLRILDSVKKRPLAFVGDGVNDAPALAAADVGIALGARGSTAASESADMVIMLDDLGRVAIARYIAKNTLRIAKQSILFGIGLSLILMVIFATGKFTPLAGAIVQEIVDVVVIFNALRAHLIKVND